METLHREKHFLRQVACLSASLLLAVALPLLAMAEATGTVKTDSLVLRKSNSKESKALQTLSKGDTTTYGVPDLKAQALDTKTAEGVQARSFQLAFDRLKARPTLAKLLIHKPGPLSDDPARLDELADVYRRGLEEVGKLLHGVKTVPG